MMTIDDIDIDMDKVTICGQVVKRPDYISRIQWLRYWEASRTQVEEE